MEMQPPINHLHHHHHHHQHLPFLPQSHPTAASAGTDFDSVFSGISLQSLLLGEPVLLTPPPPPFPPSPPPAPTPIIPTLAPPHPLQQFRDRGFPPHQPPPTFFFQAARAAPSVKQRRQPRRNHSPAAVPHPQPRRQRQKVSEKLKALRRMVPCDQKADIATMLEQAYRYVRYLEAQVLSLLTMNLYPLEDRGLFPDGGGGLGGSEIERRMVEEVGRLSRKEVVEAVVNSGAAQRVMYEEGLCLVSEEQVRVLCLSTFQKQKQHQQQQQLSGLIGGAANPGNNNNNTTNDSNNSSSSSFCYN